MQPNTFSLLHESCEDDEISCSTGLATVQATNIRRVTLSPAEKKAKMNDDRYDDEAYRRLVVRILWTVSANEADPGTASDNRAYILRILASTIDIRNGQALDHQEVYGAFLVAAPRSLVTLQGPLVNDLINILNDFDQTTQSFRRRGNLRSLIRHLLDETPVEIDVGAPEWLSEVTCAHAGDTAVNRRLLGSSQGSTDLAAMNDLVGAVGNVTIADSSAQSTASDSVGLHISDDEAHEQQAAMLAFQFRNGNFDTFGNFTHEQVLDALASSLRVLRLLLVPLREGSAQSNAPAGHSVDDFSGSGAAVVGGALPGANQGGPGPGANQGGPGPGANQGGDEADANNDGWIRQERLSGELCLRCLHAGRLGSLL